MSAQFTPGPWQWFASVRKEAPAVIDTAMGVESANVTIIAEVHRGKQYLANAHLIAAAPELYEASLFAEVALNGQDTENLAVRIALDKLRVALAKARGEA